VRSGNGYGRAGSAGSGRARTAGPAGVQYRPQSATPANGYAGYTVNLEAQRIGLEQEVLSLRKQLGESHQANRQLRVKNGKLREQVDAMTEYARDRMAAKHLIAWSTQDRKETFEKMELMQTQLESTLREMVQLRGRLREAGLPDRWPQPPNPNSPKPGTRPASALT